MIEFCYFFVSSVCLSQLTLGGSLHPHNKNPAYYVFPSNSPLLHKSIFPVIPVEIEKNIWRHAFP